MTALELLANLRVLKVRLTAKGDRLAYEAPFGIMTPELVAAVKANKAELLKALVPKPTECAWREDDHGRLVFSDGTVYASTDSGGWLLIKHPTKRMRAPGTLEASQ